MSKHSIIKFDPTVPAEFADWFGPRAVLTNEELQIYKNMLCGVYNDVKPTHPPHPCHRRVAARLSSKNRRSDYNQDNNATSVRSICR